MNKLIASLALFCALVPFAQAAENTADKPQAAPAETSKSPSTIGDGVREVGQDIKAAGRKVRRAVVTRCADGRHTVRGKAACAGHGGVSAQN